MHRIDGPGAAPGGHFTEGDPATGVIATIVTQTWAEAVQEELANAIEGAGIPLAKPNNAQLLAAIRALIGSAIPPGAIQAFARATAPDGWSAADGGELSRTAQPGLFTAIGTSWGAGNGSTTFNKPDLRGEFVRGWDAGRGVDAGRAFGALQAGQVQTHKHVMAWGEDSSDPAQYPFGKTTGAGKHGASTSDNNNYQFYTNDGSNIDNAVNAPGVIGAETRPRNVALLYCIKL